MRARRGERPTAWFWSSRLRCGGRRPVSVLAGNRLSVTMRSGERGHMRRRTFLGVLGGATAWPFIGRAQSGRLPRVGLLMLGKPDPSVFLREVTTGLRELGYEDGRNIVLELRNAKGSTAQLGSLARDLATLPVD